MHAGLLVKDYIENNLEPADHYAHVCSCGCRSHLWSSTNTGEALFQSVHILNPWVVRMQLSHLAARQCQSYDFDFFLEDIVFLISLVICTMFSMHSHLHYMQHAQQMHHYTHHACYAHHAHLIIVAARS